MSPRADLDLARELARTRLALRRRQDDLKVSKQQILELETELEETNRGLVALYAELQQAQQTEAETGRAARGADLLASRERERLEAQLHQWQRLESLGQLAGGLAHEFNNLLGIITGYAAFVEEAVAAAAIDEHRRWQPVREDVTQIQRAADRAAQFVRQLLTFGRREPNRPRALDLNTVVRGLGELVSRTVGDDVELHLDLQPGLRPIKADPSQMGQLIVNLAINAHDAMPHGGTLTISTRNQEGEAKRANSADQVPDRDETASRNTVALAVRDNGTGMAADTEARAFEPFFTTKSKATHAGLGLAVVYGIVAQGNGEVEIESAVGTGTTVVVSFPAVAEAPQNTDEPTFSDHVRRTGTGTILAIDDEVGVLEVTRRILTRHGYQVIACSSGNEACERASRHDGVLDLLLTDVVMPGMHGKEVARRIQETRPATKVLYMSGYDQQTLTNQGVLNPGVALLDKPFRDRVLLDRVRDELDDQKT